MANNGGRQAGGGGNGQMNEHVEFTVKVGCMRRNRTRVNDSFLNFTEIVVTIIANIMLVFPCFLLTMLFYY